MTPRVLGVHQSTILRAQPRSPIASKAGCKRLHPQSTGMSPRRGSDGPHSGCSRLGWVFRQLERFPCLSNRGGEVRPRPVIQAHGRFKVGDRLGVLLLGVPSVPAGCVIVRRARIEPDGLVELTDGPVVCLLVNPTDTAIAEIVGTRGVVPDGGVEILNGPVEVRRVTPSDPTAVENESMTLGKEKTPGVEPEGLVKTTDRRFVGLPGRPDP